MASEVLNNITREDIEWARQLSEEKRILDALNDESYEMEKIARKFKASGVSIEIIAGATGLSIEKVASL